MVLEDPASGFVGAVTNHEKSGGMWVVELEDRRGKRRAFPLGPGFWLEGRPITLVPARGPAAKVSRTNSGSRAVVGARAQVAKPSRIWVEGKHDAELVQHVWGADLALEGIAVEMLDGADHLEDVLTIFGPSAHAKAGVLLDHMVPGSKETRIAQAAMLQWPDHVLVLGHPYVDVWQAVKPARFGIAQWPHIPRGTDIKTGTIEALGWGCTTGEAWSHILSRVRDFRDLEPALLGRVEELIDFVTSPSSITVS